MSSFAYRLRKPIAAATALLLTLFTATESMLAAQIVPGGATATAISVSGNVTDVSTSTVIGNTGLNSFERFNVGSGDVVNLHLPSGTSNLINLVHDEATTISGILNSILTTSEGSVVGGNVYLLNPHGILVSADGVINVGEITLATPTTSFMEDFLKDATAKDAVDRVLDGTIPVNHSGTIVVDGTINAVSAVRLMGGSVTSGGKLSTGADFSWSNADFSDVVNLTGLVSGTAIEAHDGGIYITGDEITLFGDPEGGLPGQVLTGGHITLKAPEITLENGAHLEAAGDITLTAEAESAPLFDIAEAGTSIAIDGATLKGTNITITAESDAKYTWDGDLTSILYTTVTGAVGSAVGVNAAWAHADAGARIRIGSGTVLDARGDVELTSKSTAAASTMTLEANLLRPNPVGLAAVYGELDATAVVDIESGAAIKANNLTVISKNEALLAINAYAFSPIEGDAEAAAAISDVDIDSRAAIDPGVALNLAGNLEVRAENRSDLVTKSVALAWGKAYAGAAVALTWIESSATARVESDVVGAQDVTVLARDRFDNHQAYAVSNAGSPGWLVILAGLSPSIEALFQLQKDRSGAKGKTLDPQWKVSGSVTYVDSEQSAKAYLGEGVTIDAKGGVSVDAVTLDRNIRNHAISEVASRSKEEATPGDPAASIAVSGAVAWGEYAHDARAFIGDNATVTARDVDVTSRAEIPHEILYPHSESTTNRLKDVSFYLSILNANLGVANNILNGFADAQQSTTEFGIAGAINHMVYNTASKAYLGRGVTINLGAQAAGEAASLDIEAVNRVEGAFAAANIDLLFDGVGGRESDAVSVGGSTGRVVVNGTTEAYIAEGAVVRRASEAQDAGGQPLRPEGPAHVSVNATTFDRLIMIVPSSGLGYGIGVMGLVGLVDVNDTTYAAVDDEASVSADTLAVSAASDIGAWNIGGLINKKDAASVGNTVALNTVNSDTRAIVGDIDELITGGSSRSVTDARIRVSTLDVDARTDGTLQTITVAAAATKSDAPPGQEADGTPSDPEAASGAEEGIEAAVESAASRTGSTAPKKPLFGLSVSGNSSVNVARMTTKSYVDGTVVALTGDGRLDVKAVNRTDAVAAGGGAALMLVRNPFMTRTLGLAGSVAVNDFENTTEAYVRDASVTGARQVSVRAASGGEQIAIATSLAATASVKPEMSGSLAGAVSITEADNTTSAYVGDAAITGAGGTPADNDIEIVAHDRSRIGTGGGSLAGGARASVGAGVAYSSIHNTVTAKLTGAESAVTQFGSLSIRASNSVRIAAGAGSSAISPLADSLTIAGAVVVNEVGNATRATISGATVSVSDGVTLVAREGEIESELDDVLDAALGEDPDGSTLPSESLEYDFSGAEAGGETAPSSIVAVAGFAQFGAINAGISVVSNRVENVVRAEVTDADITVSGGELGVQAGSSQYIGAVAVGAGLSVSQFQGAGSLVLNEIANTIHASIGSSDDESGDGAGEESTSVHARAVGVSAVDASRIDAFSGQASGGGAVSAGFAAADSVIGNRTVASVSRASIGAEEALVVGADAEGTIRTFSVTGSLLSGSALHGSVSTAEIANVTRARASDVSLVAFDDGSGSGSGSDSGSGSGSAARPDVVIRASDDSTIQTLSGAVVFAQTQGAGAAVSVNRIDNTTEAILSGGTLGTETGAGSLVVQAVSDAAIDSVAAGLGGGTGAGASGSSSTNLIDNDVSAIIEGGAVVVALDNVGVIAQSDDAIRTLAGAAGVSLVTVGVGASVTVDEITGTTQAAIRGAGTEVTALAQNEAAVLEIDTGRLEGVDLAESLDVGTYARADLKSARESEAVRGVAVSASSTHSIESLAVTVGAGEAGGLAATSSTQILSGSTQSTVDGAAINGAEGEASAAQGLVVRASDASYVNAFVGSVAAGATGGGAGAANVSELNRDARAVVTSAKAVGAQGAMAVEALSTNGVSSLVVGGAGSELIAGVGSGSAAKFGGTTDAYVRVTGPGAPEGAKVSAGSLNVLADRTNRNYAASGGLSGAGAVGFAGSFVVAEDYSNVRAAIEETEVAVSAAGSAAGGGEVNVAARNVSEVDAWAISAGLGGYGVGAAAQAVVVLLAADTRGYVQDSEIGTSGGRVGSLNVAANDAARVNVRGGGLGTGGVGGFGAVAAVTKIDNSTRSYVEGGSVYSGSGGVNVLAGAERDVSTTAVTAGMGIFGALGGTAAVVLLGGNLNDDVRDELDKDGSGTLTVAADFTGSDVKGEIDRAPSGSTSARIMDVDLDTTGSVLVDASEVNRVEIVAGAGAGGAVGVGGSVGVLEARRNVEAVIGSGSSVAAAGGIAVRASADRLADETAFSVRSYQGSLGVVSLGAAVADAHVTYDVSALIGAGTTLVVGEDGAAVALEADDRIDVSSMAQGYQAGGAAAGAVVARAERDGRTEAGVGDGSTVQGSAGNQAGAVTLSAQRSGRVEARTRAGSGGVLAGAGSDAQSFDLGAAAATVGENVSVHAAHLGVSASATPEVYARSEGYGGAIGGFVGIGIARAEARPDVTATIGRGGLITAGSLTVHAAVDRAGAATAKSWAQSVGVGLGVGVDSALSVATSRSNVTASLASELAISGDVSVSAINHTRSEAEGLGVVAGLLSVGGVTARAESDSATRSVLTEDVSGQIGGGLTLSSVASSDVYGESTSGAGAAVGMSAANAKTRIDAETASELGTSFAGLTAGSIKVDASHTSEFNAKVDTVFASLVGGSGARTDNEVDSRVQAAIADGAIADTYQLDLVARNLARKSDLSGRNVTAGSGGLINAAAAESKTAIDFSTLASVGDHAVVRVIGDRLSPGSAALSAYNQIDASDRVKLDTGGVIDIPKAASTIEVEAAEAVVRVGEGAILDSVGAVNLSTRSNASVRAESDVRTYGAAAAAAGYTDARVRAANRVEILDGARLRADGDIFLGAGRDAAGSVNAFDITARTDLFNKTLVPIDTKPDADARLDLTALVVVSGGADVRSRRDVLLYAEEGDVSLKGKGTGRDLWRELASEVGGAVSKALGTGDLSIKISGGSKRTDIETGVLVDGTVRAGAYNQQYLIIGPGADASLCQGVAEACSEGGVSKTDGITYSFGTENLVNNLIARLEELAQLKTEYYSDPAARAAYEAEINFIERELKELGFVVEAEPEDGEDPEEVETEYILEELFVDVINVEDSVASGGDIIVIGRYLAGSGSLLAPRDTKIEIVNQTSAFLRIHDLAISDHGGRILFNGSEVDSVERINQLNTGGVTADFETVEAAGSSSDVPLISVTQAFIDPESTLPPPDLYVTGDIFNFSGDVRLTNVDGSIKIQAEGADAAPSITANAVYLQAGRSVLQSYVDGFVHTGGDPRSLWDDVVDWTRDKGYTPWECQNRHSGDPTIDGWPLSCYTNGAVALTLKYRNGKGSMIAGNDVFIGARYLNLNGTIQSGIADWQVNLDPNSGDFVVIQEVEVGIEERNFGGFRYWVPIYEEIEVHMTLGEYIDWLKQEWVNQGRPSLTGIADLAPYQISGFASDPIGTIAAYFNPETEQIVLNEAAVRGGYVELSGHIMNTGGGRIRVMDGYGRINVSNTTGYDLAISGLSTGNDIEGVVRITDTAKRWLGDEIVRVMDTDDWMELAPVTTVFRRVGNELRTEIYRADELMDVDIDASGSRETQYNPAEDQWFIWQTGQDFMTTHVGYKESKKAIGIDLGGSSSYDTWETVAIGEERDLPDGMFVGWSGSNAVFRYDEDVYITAELTRVDRRKWSKCNGTLCLSRTYKVKDTYQQGELHVFTHGIPADEPISIQFIGYDEGEINVTSLGSLLLSGAVQSAGGFVGLTSSAGAITQTSSKAVVTGSEIALSAETSIGTDTSALTVRQTAGDGALSAETQSGNINLKSDAGDVRVGLIRAGQGAADVTLRANGSIVQAAPGSAAAIVGRRVSLSSTSGGIGTWEQALNVQAGSEQPVGSRLVGFDAFAAGDIVVRQADGDFRLITVESLGGDVYLEAAAGSIVDANPTEEADERTIDELRQLWAELNLTEETGAAVSIEATLNAYRTSKEQEYHRYWREYRSARAEFDAEGNVTYVYDPYDPENPDPDYQALSLAYGAEAYDPNWTYVLSADEIEELSAGAVWTERELMYGVSSNILFKETGSTQVRDEDPNVIGRNVTLVASQGSVGVDRGELVIDLSDPAALEDEHALIALAAAEADDVTIDDEAERIIILLRDSIDVEASGSIEVQGLNHLYIGSRDPIYVKTVTSGGSIRIKGSEGLYSVATSAPANIQGGSVILEGGQDAGIGTADSPLTVDLQPGATLTARAGGDIYVSAPAGALALAEIFSDALIRLEAAGGIFDQRGERPYAVQGERISLLSHGGTIGSSAAPLTFVAGSLGNLSAEAGSGIYLASPSGVVNLGDLTTGGEVSVEALFGNLRLQGQVSAFNASIAAGGSITQSVAGGFDVEALTTVSSGGLALLGDNARIGRLDAVNFSGDVEVHGENLTLGRIDQREGGEIAVAGDVLVLEDLVSTSDDVTLTSGSSIAQTGQGAIQARRLAVTGSGNAALTGANVVEEFTADFDGDIQLATAGPLAITGVRAYSLGTTTVGGFTVSGNTDVEYLSAANSGGGEIRIQVGGSPITLGEITQVSGGDIVVSAHGITLAGNMTTTGDVTLTSSGLITATAGGGTQTIEAHSLVAEGVGGIWLNTSNTVSEFRAVNSGGGIRFGSIVDVTIGGIEQLAGGDIELTAHARATLAGAVRTSDSVTISALGSSASIEQTAAGVIEAGWLTLGGGTHTLTAQNRVADLMPGFGTITFYNDAPTLAIDSSLNVTTGRLNLVTSGDLVIGKLQYDYLERLEAGGSITMASADSFGIQAGNAYVYAGGSVGADGAPLRFDVPFGSVDAAGEIFVAQDAPWSFHARSSAGDVNVSMRLADAPDLHFSGRNVTLAVEEGDLGNDVTGWARVVTAPGGALRAEAPGHIWIAGVEGDLTIDRVNAGGRVDLFAIGSIYGAGGDGQLEDGDGEPAGAAHAIGTSVTLRSLQGGVGTGAAPIRIDSGNGAVRANAAGGIYVTELTGDLRIDQLVSGSGEVVAEALTGSILGGGSANSGAYCGIEGSCFLKEGTPAWGFWLCEHDNSCRAYWGGGSPSNPTPPAKVAGVGATLIAGAGSIGTESQPITVNVTDIWGLGALSATATGDVYVDAPLGRLTVGDMSTPSGTIKLNTVGALDIAGTMETAGEVHLTAGGSVAETSAGRITGAALLAVTSTGGQQLAGNNAVRAFNALNTGSGHITLINTSEGTLEPFTIAGITQLGGDVVVENWGDIFTTGEITTTGGNISVTAHSHVTVGAGIMAGGPGAISLSASENVTTGATVQSETGDIHLDAGQDVRIDEEVATAGRVSITAGGKVAESDEGRITGASLLSVESAGGQQLTGNNAVQAFHAVNVGGDVHLTNTGDLIITGMTQSGGELVVDQTGDLLAEGAPITVTDGSVTLRVVGAATFNSDIETTGEGNNIVVETTGDLTANAALTSEGGSVQISAGGDIVSGGWQTGGDTDIVISANNDLTLTGDVSTLGDVILTAGGAIRQVGEGSIAAYLLKTTSNGEQSLTGANRVTLLEAFSAGGDIDVNNALGLLIAQIVTEDGDVTVRAGGTIRSATADGAANIRAATVTLVAAGGVGSASRALYVDSSYGRDGVLRITADGDVYVDEIEGDLNLLQILAGSGDIVLNVADSLFNVAPEKVVNLQAGSVTITTGGLLGEPKKPIVVLYSDRVDADQGEKGKHIRRMKSLKNGYTLSLDGWDPDSIGGDGDDDGWPGDGADDEDESGEGDESEGQEANGSGNGNGNGKSKGNGNGNGKGNGKRK